MGSILNVLTHTSTLVCQIQTMGLKLNYKHRITPFLLRRRFCSAVTFHPLSYLLDTLWNPQILSSISVLLQVEHLLLVLGKTPRMIGQKAVPHGQPTMASTRGTTLEQRVANAHRCSTRSALGQDLLQAPLSTGTLPLQYRMQCETTTLLISFSVLLERVQVKSVTSSSTLVLRSMQNVLNSPSSMCQVQMQFQSNPCQSCLLTAVGALLTVSTQNRFIAQ